MIKKGDKFLCKFDNYKDDYFKKGNIYEVIDTESTGVILLTEAQGNKFISFYGLHQSFTDLQEVNEIEVKDAEIVTPKHYNNDNGTLYKIANERGWNSYLFDIVKRLERSEKKGEFNQDLEKSIAVIQLWQKEQTLKNK